MKTKANLIALTSAILATTITTTASADDTKLDPKPYLGATISHVNFEATNTEDANLMAIGSKFGIAFNKYIAIEGRLGTGITEQEDYDGIDGLSLAMDYYIGGYLVAQAPVHEKFSLYALAGYTKAEATLEMNNISISDDESDFSYGIGAEFKATDKASITLEYQSLLDGADYQLTALSAGAKITF